MTAPDLHGPTPQTQIVQRALQTLPAECALFANKDHRDTVHLDPTCGVHRALIPLDAALLTSSPDRTWVPCPRRCGNPEVGQSLYRALLCAGAHDELTFYLTAPLANARFAARDLVARGPATLYALARETRDAADPLDLGTAALGQATLAQVEHLCPEALLTHPRTVLIHAAGWPSVSPPTKLALAFGMFIATGDTGVGATGLCHDLYAVGAAHAEHIFRPRSTELRAFLDLPAELTAVQVQVLATSWDPSKRLAAQIDAVHAATL